MGKPVDQARPVAVTINGEEREATWIGWASCCKSTTYTGSGESNAIIEWPDGTVQQVGQDQIRFTDV